MRVVLAIAAHRLRRGWRGWAALALLTAFSCGAVLAAAAGARRTDTAFPRFLAASASADVLMGPAQSGVGGYDLAVGRLPGVTQIAPVVGLNAGPVVGGKLQQASEVAAPLDGRLGHQLERPKMLAGREPRPDRADEVMIDQTAASQLRPPGSKAPLRVGSTLRLVATPDPNYPLLRVRHLTVHVVGIEVLADSIVPVNVLAQTAYIQASPALYHELGAGYQAFDGEYVKLAADTTVAEFTAEATALAKEKQYKSTGGQIFVADEKVQDATAQRSIRPEAVALAIFALVLALTALLVLGQAASRLLQADSRDNPVVAALGLTRWQLLTVGLLQVTIAAAIGAGLAVAVALAASPMMPIGAPARLAELHPGVSFDPTVLLPGFVALVLLLVALSLRTAWRESSVRLSPVAAAAAGPGYGSRVARWLAGSGAPVTAVTGVRMALEPGRGRAVVPVRGALIGIALSVAAVMASVTFGANLVHLDRTPRLYGQTWDAAVDLQFGVILPSKFNSLVSGVPGITAWTYGYHGTVNLPQHGGVIPAVGLADGRGPLLAPTMLTGHLPRAGQIVLGTLTMRHGGIRLGQRLTASASGQGEQVTVVGRAVFPYFGQGSFTATDLGQGAVVPASMLAAQATAATGKGYNFILLAFAPGPRKAAELAVFRRHMASYCNTVEQSTCVVTSQLPNGVRNDQPVEATPLILAGLLALLGLGVLAQFSFQSARSRRRDFAVLRTLGLQRRQLTAVTSWQISALTLVALAVGLPVGAAAGHWAWSLFADVLGISPGTTIPVMTGILLIPAVLLAANLVAFWPGRRSARARPAMLLRAE